MKGILTILSKKQNKSTIAAAKSRFQNVCERERQAKITTIQEKKIITTTKHCIKKYSIKLASKTGSSTIRSNYTTNKQINTTILLIITEKPKKQAAAGQ